MHERKRLMYDMSDVFVAFPGGIGTLDETFEAMTWSALGIFAKPLGFLDVESFWSPLLAWLRGAVDQGVMSERRRALFEVVDTDAGRLLDRLLATSARADGVISPSER
jgi:uncharacterized protein (TIGR00730 family)